MQNIGRQAAVSQEVIFCGMTYAQDNVKVNQSHYRHGQAPEDFQEVEAHRFQDNPHLKVVKVVSPTHWPPLPPGKIPGTHFYYSLSQPHGHSAARKIMSIKNCNDIIGNRTRDLPVCSAVPQTTAPTRAAQDTVVNYNTEW